MAGCPPSPGASAASMSDVVHGTNEKTFCGEDEVESSHLGYEYLSTLALRYLRRAPSRLRPGLAYRSIVHRRAAVAA